MRRLEPRSVDHNGGGGELGPVMPGHSGYSTVVGRQERFESKEMSLDLHFD